MLEKFERYPLTFGLTPIEKLNRLSAHVGGGVITYTANGAQKVAVAAGFTHIAWPTKIVTAKIVVLGVLLPI